MGQRQPAARVLSSRKKQPMKTAWQICTHACTPLPGPGPGPAPAHCDRSSTPCRGGIWRCTCAIARGSHCLKHIRSRSPENSTRDPPA